MTDRNVKLLVIGAGPGGYVCAIKAAKSGIETLVVEAVSYTHLTLPTKA